MEQEIKTKLEELDKKIESIYKSVEKTRKYFLWTLITTLAFFILPIVGLIVVIPQFISTYENMFQGL